jgi:ABC-type bacteriocin/lantibiotic exporter with double-glycine peptidase domain
MFLFIIISELESRTLTEMIESTESSNLNANTSSTDQETVNDESSTIVKVSSPLIKLCHLTIFLLCTSSLIYSGVKFAVVLVQITSDSSEFRMHGFYFSAICVELGFSFVQFLFSLLSIYFMQRLRATPLSQLLQNENSTEKKKVNIRRLISLSHPERFLIMIAFVMLMISSSTNIIVPYFFGAIVDSALNYPDLSKMSYYILYMFLVFVIGSVAAGVRSCLFEMAGQRVVARLRRQVFEAIMKQDIKFFDINRTGELTSRISSDTQVLQNSVTTNLSMLTRYLFQIIGSVIFMFILEPSLTGLLLGVIPVVVLLTVAYGRYLRKLRKIFQDELATSNVTAEESISSARTVRSFAAETKVAKDYDKNIDKSFRIGVKLAYAGGGFMVFIGLLSAAALSLILWYGGKLVHDKKLTTGILASFLMYTLQVAM